MILIYKLGKAEGRALPSFVSYHLERLHCEHRETDEELDDIRGAAGSIYVAGADTVSTQKRTSSSFHLFDQGMTFSH